MGNTQRRKIYVIFINIRIGNKMNEINAACLIIEINNKIVAVSRRGSTTQFGFPGGKVDQGETPVDAIIRESFEEIGWKPLDTEIELVYSGHCGSYMVNTYRYIGIPPRLDSLIAEDNTMIKMLTAEELCYGDISPFSEYNKQVFGELK